MESMSARLDDVAKQSGFSIATVSRVVNGVDGVRSEVRTAVEQAVRELGYVGRRTRITPVPDPLPAATKTCVVEVLLHRRSAQEQLATQPQGLVVGPLSQVASNDFLSRSWELSNDFYRSILDGILDELPKHGGKALVRVVKDLNDPTLISSLGDHLAGVLIVGEGGPDVSEFLDACRVPVTLVDIIYPAGGHEVVTTDNLTGIGQAVEHLASLGHRRLGYISGSPNAATDERATAFTYHCSRLGLEIAAGWQAVEYDSIASTTDRIASLLTKSKRPTAIACCNDWGALSTYHAAARCELSVPQDLSVVGFDDGLVAATVTPPLTTIRVATNGIGRMAVRLVLTQKTTDRGSITRLPTQLIVRHSTQRVSVSA